jgi:predicted RNase H-like nuclease
MWLEPFDHKPGWRLQIKIKDGESCHRRIEIYTQIESQVFDALARILTYQEKPKPMSEMQWSDWVAIAKQKHQSSQNFTL